MPYVCVTLVGKNLDKKKLEFGSLMYCILEICLTLVKYSLDLQQLSLQKCIVSFAVEYRYFIWYEVCTYVNILFENLEYRKYDVLEPVKYYAYKKYKCVGI